MGSLKTLGVKERINIGGKLLKELLTYPNIAIGQDVFSKPVCGARISLLVSTTVAIASVTVGVLVGLLVKKYNTTTASPSYK